MREEKVWRCEKCQKPFTEQRPKYAKGMHKSCYEITRRSDTKDVEEYIADYEQREGAAEEFFCHWCEKHLFGRGDKGKTAVAWFMDQPVCETHLKLAERWARFALRN